MKAQYKYKQHLFLYVPGILLAIFLLYLLTPFLLEALLTKGVDVKKSFLVESVEEIQQENITLRSDLIAYEKSDQIIKILSIENNRLKKELGYQAEIEQKRERFPLTFSSGSNIFETLVFLDPQEKTSKNDLVFVYKNFILGKVSTKISNLAKVTLFSALGEENNFFLQNGEEVILKVKGVGEGSGTIKVLAPRDFDFVEKEEVFLLFEDNTDYIVGYLVDSEFKTQDTTKTLYFKIFANTSLLNHIYVQNKTDPEPETVLLQE